MWRFWHFTCDTTNYIQVKNDKKSLVTRSCHRETFLSDNGVNIDKMVENPNAGHSIAML